MNQALTLEMFKSAGNINEVVSGLFIGNKWSTDPNVLNQYNINCVLNVSTPEADVNRGRYKLDSHVIMKIEDIPTPLVSKKMFSEVIPNAMRYLDTYLNPEAPSNKRVLVHCNAGISRSATVILAWLMKTYGMTRDTSIQFLRSRRSIIHPNDGFMRVLKEWEDHLKRVHNNNASRSERSARGGRAYNYSEEHKPRNRHHLFPSGFISDSQQKKQLQQFERQFSVIPSEASSLQPSQQQAPSYYREFGEKVYSNDDAFNHLY